MGSEFQPDDSLLERDPATKELAGTTRVKDYLKRHNIPFPDRVLTSQDEGMEDVRRELAKKTNLKGVEQWQLPILIDENLIWVLAHHDPDVVIPPHHHEGWVLHIVLHGELEYEDRRLRRGDFILVPPGKTYSLRVVGGDATTCYVHNPVPIPGPTPPGPGPTKPPSR